MSLQFPVTRKMSWLALSIMAWSIIGVGSVLEDPSSMPVEKLILEDTTEALSKDASPAVRPAPLAPLGPGLSTIGLDFEMSRLFSDTNFIPPDTMGNVGPDHIVELINGRYEVYDKKTGLMLESFNLDGFWTLVVGLDIPQGNICQDDDTCARSGEDCSVDPCANNLTFDPRIVYDWQTQRWFALSIDSALGQDNDFYLGRSESSDPTGSWAGVKFDSDTVGLTEFHDYETFSVDADAVTSCTQDFSSGSGGGGVESCYTIPKADVLLPVPSVANMTRFESNPPDLPPVSGSIQPALSFEPAADGVTPLLGVNGGLLVRGDILGAGAAGATLAPTGGIAGDPGHAKPPAARQPAADPGATIENVAPRIVANVVEIGDSLWAVHAVAGSVSNSAIRWYEIGESTDTIIQTGLIEDVNEDYHEPSIAVNSLGDVVIGYTCSGPNLNASVCISVGQTIGGVTTFDPTQVTTLGDGLYYRTFGGTRNRWGDYSATVVDPDDECTFWTMQEFVAVGGPDDVGPAGPGVDDDVEGGRYGTEVTEIIINACAESDIIISKADSPDPVVAGTDLAYTLDVANLGPTRAFNVVSSDLLPLPADVTFVSSVDGDWSCVHAAGTVTCEWAGGNPVASLAADQAADSITLTVAVNPSMVFEGRTSLSNTADAASDTPDPDPGNNEATELTTVVAETDLDIERFEAVDPPDEILVADDVAITLEKDVSNHGPSWPVNTRVTVNATAPADSTVSPATAIQDVLIPELDTPVLVTEEFVVNCGAASHHVWTFENTIEPTDASTTDPDLSNNTVVLDLEIECVVPVIINIAPGSDPNSQQRLKGTVPLAILATTAGEYGTPLDFDVMLVDPLSVRFGPREIFDDDGLGATEQHNRGHFEDSYELDEVTMDGDTDLVMHFKMQDTGLETSDTEGCVKGEFTDATGTHQFFGCDAIRFPPGSD
jgi:uncharacterized repeat protein (TIGR01451 family)